MRDREPPKRAPDYTNAALAMGLVNLVWIFLFLWAAVGYWAVIGTAFALNALISRLETRLQDE